MTTNNRTMAEQARTTQDNGDLDDPVQARIYVEQFAQIHLGETATYVRTSGDRLIHFKTMSDDDAVWVAHQFQSWLPENRK